MKLVTIIAGMLVSSIAFTQGVLTYRSPKADPKLIISGKDGQIIPDKSFELTGNVRVESKTDRFVVTGNSATGALIKEANQTVADNVRIRGNVVLVQAQQDGILTLTGQEADYDILTKETLQVQMRGAVTVNFKSTKEGVSDWSSTAKSTVAVIKRNSKKEENALLSAGIEGPMTYSGISKGDKGLTKIKAQADRMLYSLKPEGSEVKLSGNLKFDQTGPGDEDGGEVTGAQTAILDLNRKNEVTRVRFSSEGIGKIRTVKRVKGGSGI